MLMSRNPRGEIEAYTDIGQFIGILPPDYPGIDLAEFSDDGGPGSGNWGHRGRPGKRGGSGKGGGNQYRGGRADITYAGSRKDWMNGLSGEVQHEATKHIVNVRKEMESKKDYFKNLQSLREKGLLTEDEVNQMLEKNNLKNFREDMTPEEYTMACGTEEDRAKLIGYVSVARGWEEYKDRLKNENLSDEEKVLLDYADEHFFDLDEDGKRSYFDLKAKAMGLPESGEGIPDELYYESGLKERPAPPKPTGPDYDWFNGKNVNNAAAYLLGAIGEHGFTYAYGHHYTVEEFRELNQKFLDKMKYGNPSPNEVSYYGINAVNGLRNAMRKASETYINVYEDFKYTPEMYARLSDDEKEKLVELVNTFGGGNRSTGSKFTKLEDITEDDFFEAEKVMRSMTPRSKEAKQPLKDYILLQEKLMIGAEPSETNTVEAEKNQKKADAEAQKKAKAEQRKKEQAEFRNSPAAEKKRKTQETIHRFDPEELRKPETTTEDVRKAVMATGMFRDGSKFVTTDAIPKDAYIDAAQAYKDVIEKFPFLAGELGGFGDEYISSRASAGCCAEAFTSRTEIIINYKTFGTEESDRIRRKGIESKWHPPMDDHVTSAYATTAHELGHALANWLQRAVYGQVDLTTRGRSAYFDNEVATELKERTLKALKIKPTMANIKNELSEYGAATRGGKTGEPASKSKADEFFAECICELMCSSNPRRVALEFQKQLNKFINDNGIDGMTSATTPSTIRAYAD